MLHGRGSTEPLPPCPTCGAGDPIVIPTYKRIWGLCRQCGTGYPRQRRHYALAGLPVRAFKRQTDLDDESIYDYFTSPEAIAYAKQEAAEFVCEGLEANGIEVAGRRVLDVSGGSGQVAAAIRDLGADVTLTEINRPAIEYARETLGLHAVHYRFEDGPLAPRLDRRRYDLILLRACIMFCDDLGAFLTACREVLNRNGLVVIDRSVKPTLGVVLRVQLDEFSYSILRQPETVVSECEAAGLAVEGRVDWVDPDLYVYDHDLLRSWTFLRWVYELRAVRRLRHNRGFDFPARDRRLTRVIARHV
jgi:SAM-dependent methyltransferase